MLQVSKQVPGGRGPSGWVRARVTGHRHRGVEAEQGPGVKGGRQSLSAWPLPGELQVLMEKEPQDALCTESRLQALHIISSLW